MINKVCTVVLRQVEETFAIPKDLMPRERLELGFNVLEYRKSRIIVLAWSASSTCGPVLGSLALHCPDAEDGMSVFSMNGHMLMCQDSFPMQTCDLVPVWKT